MHVFIEFYFLVTRWHPFTRTTLWQLASGEDVDIWTAEKIEQHVWEEWRENYSKDKYCPSLLGKVGGNDTRKGPIVFEQTNKQTNNYSDIRAITFVQSLTSSFFSTVSHELGYIRMTGCHFMSRKKRGDVWKEKFISLETSFPHDIRYVACLSSGLGDDIKWLCKNRQNRKTDRKRQQDQFLFHRPPRPKPSKNTLLFYLSRKTSIGGF